jgi:hypothetical protein
VVCSRAAVSAEGAAAHGDGQPVLLARAQAVTEHSAVPLGDGAADRADVAVEAAQQQEPSQGAAELRESGKQQQAR